MTRKILIFAALLLSAVSCSIKQEDNPSEGILRVNIQIAHTTKASVAEEKSLLENSVINIYKSDFSGLVRHYSYSDLPAEIYLPSDSYRIDVLSGPVTSASSGACWDKKSYKGSQTVQIKPSTSESVMIEAGVCNAVTLVSFDDSIEGNFNSGYSFSITTGEENATLVYDASRSGAEGYFLIGNDDVSFRWTFKGTLKDGTAVESTGQIADIQKGKLYKMTPAYTVTEGTVLFSLVVDYDVDALDDIIVFNPVSTGLAPSKASEIWAGHATIHADVDESEYTDPSAVSFEYTSDDSNWTAIASKRTGEGTYDGIMTGLLPQTTYSYRLLIGKEIIGSPLSLTTADAPQLPNNGFEVTSNTESSKWTSFYDPSSSYEELKTKFWDSGSSASAGLMGASYAICYSDSDVPSGIGSTKSARLQSMYAVVKFAAGNLFVGEFSGLDGMNGKVNFGRPWTSRPTAVRFWYKYSGGKIDHAGGGAVEGEYDMFSIQIALGTWSHTKYGGSRNCPVQVNTGDQSTFWDYPTLPETIAYGKLEERGTGSTSSWKQVIVPLDYKDSSTFPTYILVSCAASKWGDYFAGCSSSKLYLDNFELVYE